MSWYWIFSALFLLVGLGMATYRRYILRPTRLKNTSGEAFPRRCICHRHVSFDCDQRISDRRVADCGHQTGLGSLVAGREAVGLCFHRLGRSNRPQLAHDYLDDPYADRVRLYRQHPFHQVIPYLHGTHQYIFPID